MALKMEIVVPRVEENGDDEYLFLLGHLRAPHRTQFINMSTTGERSALFG